MSDARELSFSRVLHAPRSAVWACWSDSELIKRWFVPAPHKVTACAIDLRSGGRFDTTFQVGDQTMENKGVFLEVVDGEKLVFTDAYSADWEPSTAPFMTAIVTFEDTDDGETLYTATVRHWTEEDSAKHRDMGFYEGWGIVADQLGDCAAEIAAKA